MKAVEFEAEKRIHYSRISDVLYFLFDDHARVGDHVEEAMPGVNLDYDEQGKLVGVEVLNASKLLKEFIKKIHTSVEIK